MDDLLACAETLIELRNDGASRADLHQYAVTAMAAALRGVQELEERVIENQFLGLEDGTRVPPGA